MGYGKEDEPVSKEKRKKERKMNMNMGRFGQNIR